MRERENPARGLKLDLYNSFIIEAVQRESSASALARRNTHTPTHSCIHLLTRSNRQSGEAFHLQPVSVEGISTGVAEGCTKGVWLKCTEQDPLCSIDISRRIEHKKAGWLITFRQID